MTKLIFMILYVLLGTPALLLPLKVSSGVIAAHAAEITTSQISAEFEPKPVAEMSFVKGLLSVTAKDADIRTLMGAIAAKCGIEIVLDKNITGKVTVEFRDMKFEDGLKKVLNDVVEGGFSSEYVKNSDEKSQLALSKVTIARIGKGAKDLKDMLYISDITVQDAVGKEVAFAKWGSGTGEIPLMINTIDGIEYRVGFYMMRVGEDGTFYFVHFGHNKVYVYNKDGTQKRSISFSGRISNIDTDHEGNIYLIEANEGSRDGVGKVWTFDSEGKKLNFITMPRDKAFFTGSAVIDDGILKDGTTSGKIYDFRKFLKNQDGHATRKRYFGKADAYITSVLQDDKLIGHEFTVWGVDNMGLPQRFIKTAFPQEWNPGDDSPAILGVDGLNRIYCLVSVTMQTPQWRYNNYAIAVVDPSKTSVGYFKISELDNFVHEHGNLWNNFNRIDTDGAGNVYQLFTSKDGVHIYKYSLGEGK